VPLSDHEQRMLQQMEQALYDEDPQFANRLQHSVSGAARRRIVLGAIGVILGLGLVVLGVMNAQIPLGGIGFIVMVAGAAYALSRGRPQLSVVAGGQAGAPGTRPSAKKSGTRSSFMQRLEHRWERRGDER
jgi:hypothetical protein